MSEPPLVELVRLHQMEVEDYDWRGDRSVFTDGGPDWGKRAAVWALDLNESWTSTMSYDPWARDWQDDSQWINLDGPPEFSDHDHCPTYHPEEDEDPGDWEAAPLRQPLRQHTCQPDTFGGVTQAVFERMLTQAGPVTDDAYAKAWAAEMVSHERRARLAEEEYKHRQALLQERRAQQFMDMTYGSREAREAEASHEVWDFLPDHPFEQRGR